MKYYKGYYYHIYNRGNNRQNICIQDHDYIRLLELFTKNKDNYSVSFIAFCLMPNHYHLILRQNGGQSLSKFIKSTFQSYVQSFNHRNKRTGKLFEGKAQGKLIDETEYLLHLCRYVHLNPVEAGFVQKADDWKYSNYLEFIGKRNEVLFDSEFMDTYAYEMDNYREFVVEYDTLRKENKEIEKYLFNE